MVAGTNPEPLSASGRSSEKLSLPTLQSKMKADPEGYTAELSLVYRQFNSALDLFRQQASISFSPADPAIAKDLGDRAMFFAHVAPFYPGQLTDFPAQLAGFLGSSARILPSGLRVHTTQALILLINRNMVDIGETLRLFMELQTLGDRTLRKLAFSHVIQSIRRMNKKHKNEAKNRALQNILFKMLEQENEVDAKRALVTLCELHRRRVWFNDRTADAICKACFHPASRIMIAAISFLLDYEKLDDGNDSDSDGSSDEDEENAKLSQVVLNKETIYKARNKGTVASKKKKKAKLLRIVKSMKRKQRLSSENNISNYYSPLSHLKDAQGFVERLFSRLQTCNERFEVKMLILKVISRTVGLHKLILLNFYAYLQKYIQPHQRDITNLLAAAIQACHDMVPPDAVEPLFKQIVNQFVHDRSRPEAIAVGLNSVREICLRMPLLMTEDLLQDLVLYKKSHEKAVSAAARSLITLFREICPSLLVKKDRGRPTELKAKPKAYGEVNVASSVPGLELLQQDDDNGDDDDIDADDDGDETRSADDDEMIDDEENQVGSEDIGSEDTDEEYDSINDEEDDEDNGDDSSRANVSDNGEQEVEEDDEAIESLETGNDIATKSSGGKRKFSDFSSQLISAESSLRALKKLAEEKSKSTASESTDGILSNEDFQRIKELKDKRDADTALIRHGFKTTNPDKRVDPASLEVHVRKRITKEEKLALVRAGREERGKYRSGTAVSHKKTGGKSNREKEHKKIMPIAAKRQKIVRNRQEKSRKSRHSGKQFRGKKAWK